MAQIQIEQEYLTSRYTSYQYLNIWSNNMNLNPSSFSILEAQPMDMLLGLDMLKKHQVSSLNYHSLVTSVIFKLIPSAQLTSERTA